jgi:hypothetical protein
VKFVLGLLETASCEGAQACGQFDGEVRELRVGGRRQGDEDEDAGRVGGRRGRNEQPGKPPSQQAAVQIPAELVLDERRVAVAGVGSPPALGRQEGWEIFPDDDVQGGLVRLATTPAGGQGPRRDAGRALEGDVRERRDRPER